eukprot:CAMPEP_0197421458 /NCGR_PEP_ID=MMETSP1170-20131217/7561_1 /TAXON_ID=54406 /ORGANISM="Sarcinochrysis sp, Strain CCMP770" /LENGTH=77 /DNA_ID=CAMNT_0042948697 /DNA_START=100 /DNA_END=333 /DNA_ORIENTATION=+
MVRPTAQWALAMLAMLIVVFAPAEGRYLRHRPTDVSEEIVVTLDRAFHRRRATPLLRDRRMSTNAAVVARLDAAVSR